MQTTDPLPAPLTAADVTRLAPLLVPGARFNTPFESGCVVTAAPDADGWLLALDSDGVECSYCLVPGAMPITPERSRDRDR